MPETTIDNRIPAKTILAAIAKGKLGDARYWRANGHDVFSILVTNAQGQPILKISRLHENDTQYMVIFRPPENFTGRIRVKDTLRVNQTPEQIKALIEERLPHKKRQNKEQTDGFSHPVTYKNVVAAIDKKNFPDGIAWEKHPTLGKSILIRMPDRSQDVVCAEVRDASTITYDIYPAGKIEGMATVRDAEKVNNLTRAIAAEYRHVNCYDNGGLEIPALRAALLRLCHGIKPPTSSFAELFEQLASAPSSQRQH